MNSWTEKEIKSLGRVITGKTPPTDEIEYYHGDGLFVSPKDLKFDSTYIYETSTNITTKAFDKFKNQVIPKDAVMLTTLSFAFGKIGIASKESITNQQIASIIANEDNNYRFIYYLMRVNTPYIFSYNSGIDTPMVPKSVFEKIKVLVCPLDIQLRIASVLTAYDDLIEINQNRIMALEKMAEELYREWFVRLRFPGHKRTKDLKGLPDGWAETSFDKLADYINGYPFGPEEWKDTGLPIIKIKELKEGVSEQTPRNSGETINAKYHRVFRH